MRSIPSLRGRTNLPPLPPRFLIRDFVVSLPARPTSEQPCSPFVVHTFFTPQTQLKNILNNNLRQNAAETCSRLFWGMPNRPVQDVRRTTYVESNTTRLSKIGSSLCAQQGPKIIFRTSHKSMFKYYLTLTTYSGTNFARLIRLF